MILVPGGITELRAALLDAVDEETWQAARDGFGDPDLANQ